MLKKIRATNISVLNFSNFDLWPRLPRRSVQSYEKRLFSILSHLYPFPQDFRQVKECLILRLHEMIRVPHEVAFPVIFLFVLWSRLAGRSAQTYERYSVSSIFSRLGPFPHVFGQVKCLLMLKLHKIKYMAHIVACHILFFYIILWTRLAGTSAQSYEQCSGLVLLAVWVLLPKCLVRLRSCLR